ncbi:MAG: hypothetical protein ACE5GE_16770, partial [Phycisphaerae bacterium]
MHHTQGVANVLIRWVVPGLAGLVLIANVRGQDAETAPSGFASQVDLTPLRGVAVQDTGRLKSFDTFARNML